jgi:acetyl-CoA C-acetyltransferase
MKAAVVVSTARTGIGRAYRGSLNMTKSPTMMGHAISHAVQRAGVAGEEVEDVIVGTVLAAGTAGLNVARNALFAGGLPVTVPAQSIDRQCSSGLAAIAAGARQIVLDGMEIVVAGGQESISRVQSPYFKWVGEERDASVTARVPDAYMPMLQTAEFVAAKYRVSREAQDAYAAESQRRTAQAQQRGAFDAEIVPITTTMSITDKATEAVRHETVTLARDEGNRPQTTLDDLRALKPVIDGGVVTAGNASQLSDGASACVLMEESVAQRRGIAPLGRYVGIAVAGCFPQEMGIGPVYAIPKLLARHRMTVDDVGLWELNEAFAVQAVYCRDQLGIDPAKYNVDGGAIAIGHPYGMSGARMVGHALLAGKARNVRHVVVAMCTGGGMGVAALFEVL